MKFTYLLILTLGLLHFLESCDPNNSYRKTVSNQTVHDLLITEYLNKITQNTYTIKSNSESIIYNFSRLGGNNQTCKFLSGDSLGIQVIGNASLIVRKDLNLEDNWFRNSKGSSTKGYTVECRAIITDADIVPK